MADEDGEGRGRQLSPSDDPLETPRPEHYGLDDARAETGVSLDDGYFSANTVSSRSGDSEMARHAPLAQPAQPELSAISVNAETQTSPSFSDVATALAGLQDRATAADNPASIVSTSLSDSNLPDTSTSSWPRSVPQRSMTEYPAYPDQAHAALHSQVYAEPHRPPFRSRPGLPSPNQLSQSTTTLLGSPDYHETSRDRGSRTAGNSPGPTPGLYTPRNSRQIPLPQGDGANDHSSPYSSPYLHPVQPHAPKETHRAEKDVDTFSGRKKINQYEILEELGRGVHGKVKLARNLENGEFVAIKIVQRYPKKYRLGKVNAPEDKVRKEIAILKKASHPNVVSMLEVIDDPVYAKIYIVLEFCELREVDWRVKGESTVVYLEEYRLYRASHGLPDSATTVKEAKVARAADRRDMRRKAQRNEQRRTAEEKSEFWSLEFAEESDFDSSDTLSRTSSVPTDHLQLSTSVTNLEDLPEDDTLEIPPPVPEADSSNAAIANSHRLPFKEPVAGQTHAIADQDAPPSMQSSDNGTFEGFNLENLHREHVRGRQPSVADSSSSQITEAMEDEVPEEHRYVPVMTLQESRAAFRDAVLGLEYLHYHGIIHRDIKPANLLRTRERRLKISDFGVSYLGKPDHEGTGSEDVSESESGEYDEETELAKTVGTPAFYAPELCSLDITDQTVVTGQIDVWGLGVTLYCLVFARTPFTAENEFALMKTIAEGEVFIPRQRLKAVDLISGSRSASHAPGQRSIAENKRLPGERLHEEIDEDLHDLLKRLLIKDPRARITIKEVKHHPWVVCDLADKAAWIADTDPARNTEGKKIEISNEEVADAVIPLKLVERVKSVMKKTAGAFGLRKRAQSSATNPDVPHAGGAHAELKEGRRASLKIDDSVFAAFKAQREREEHPLSRSVTATPDVVYEYQPFFPENAHVIPSPSPHQHLDAFDTKSRPSMPGRIDPNMSTSASIETVRHVDLDRGRNLNDQPSLSQYASSPVEHPHPNILGGFLSGASRNIMRSMRSRERGSPRSEAIHPSQSPDILDLTEDMRGEPIVAANDINVPGVIGSPISLMRSNTGSGRGSPTSSPSASTHPSSDRLFPLVNQPTSGRLPSPAISASRPRQRVSTHSLGGGLSYDAAPYMTRDGPPTAEEEYRARENMQRRRLLEEEMSSGSTNSSRPTSSLSPAPCPPSPDDDIYNDRKLQTTQISSASSEDRLASDSFPSMPSLVSADTSVLPDPSSSESLKDDSADSSDTTHPQSRVSPLPRLQPTSEDEGYAGDNNALASDEEESDSDDEFLLMGRNRKAKSTANSQLLGHSSHGDIHSRKENRSGSSNTVKDV